MKTRDNTRKMRENAWKHEKNTWKCVEIRENTWKIRENTWKYEKIRENSQNRPQIGPQIGSKMSPNGVSAPSSILSWFWADSGPPLGTHFGHSRAPKTTKNIPRKTTRKQSRTNVGKWCAKGPKMAPISVQKRDKKRCRNNTENHRKIIILEMLKPCKSLVRVIKFEGFPWPANCQEKRRKTTKNTFQNVDKINKIQCQIQAPKSYAKTSPKWRPNGSKIDPKITPKRSKNATEKQYQKRTHF